MDESMEKYADWLDHLERTDPEAYMKVMSDLQSQMLASGPNAASNSGVGNGTANPGVEDFMSAVAAYKENMNSGASKEFKPVFPGNKVMESTGLEEMKEGIHIDVEPGFVLKTTDKDGRKVFINFCLSDNIQTFSTKTQLDENGEEQEGLHIPISIGLPHDVADKSGKTCTGYDVAVNPEAIKDSKEDKTGTFRNFLCELAIEYIEKKYDVQLHRRYKLPKLKYRGVLPPPQHYIRKPQKSKIEDITMQSSSKHSNGVKSGTQPARNNDLCSKGEKNATRVTKSMSYELFTIDVDKERKLCDRVAAAEGGSALSPELLRDAPLRIEVQCSVDELCTEQDVKIDTAPEFLSVNVNGYHAIEMFLPYPVHTHTATACFESCAKTLTISMEVNREWDTNQCDPGSAPWLLAEALSRSSENNNKENQETSLESRFHLIPSDETQSSSSRKSREIPTNIPVDENEVLPEDKFHQRDIMSQHIIDKRERDRQQKRKESEDRRAKEKKEQEEKAAKAKAAGKTWREMYPNEPETRYVNMEDFAPTKKNQGVEKTDDQQIDPQKEERSMMKKAAEESVLRWKERQEKEQNPALTDLSSTLAFELLD